MTNNDWQTKKLGEISTISSGATPSRMKPDYYLGGTIPWVKSGELSSGDVNYTEEFITHKAVNDARLKILPQGTPILAMYGATAGTAAMLNIEGTTNQAVAAIQPDIDILEPKYTFYFLKFKKSEFLRKRLGGAQPNISQKTIKSMRIPVPPLSTQQQIVEKLDAIRKLQGLNEIEIKRTEELSDGLIKRIFFSKTGKKCKINEIADGFQYGLSRAMSTNGNGIPILRINSIKDGTITDLDLKHVKVSGEELNKYKVQLDDILFNRTNSYELVGKTGIFKLPGTFMFASYLIRLKAKDEVLPDYLNYFLNSPVGQAEIKRRAKRAVSQANVNAKELGSIGIYIPDKSIQEEAVSQLNSVKQHLQILRAEKEKLVELFECLLNKELQA